MSEFEIADFDRFRFFRDTHGNIVSLEAQAFGEELFSVLDCQHFRLARLHVHDQAACKSDWLEAFEKEMDLLSDIDEHVIARPFTWGRDKDELFYVNNLLDGEDLTTYLRREGAQSPYLAARWLGPFIDLIDDDRENPMSILRFSNRNLQVVRNLESNLAELHFTEFTAWTKPGNLVVERGPDYFLAQSFLSLISGIPIRDFAHDTLPRQFTDLPESCQEAVLASLDSGPGEAEGAFFDAVRSLAMDTDHIAIPPLPHSLLRSWLREEISKMPSEESLEILTSHVESDPDFNYAIEAENGDLPALIQFMPGEATIPREGWLEQHWLAIRRQGRNFANQLAVYEIQSTPAVTMITEERPNGLHLLHLIRATGALDLEHAVGMAKRLSAAMDGLESTPSAAPIWWLPEQNVYVNLGTRDESDFVSAIENEGPDFWDRVPFRLRLHQTMQGLLEGVDLPDSIRGMAFELTKESPHIRRTSVLLPLVCMVLSGRKFRWDRPFSINHNDIPDGLIEFLNRTRETINERPFKTEMGFLSKLTDFVEVWDHQTYEEETAQEDEATENQKETGQENASVFTTVEATAATLEVADHAPEADTNSSGNQEPSSIAIVSDSLEQVDIDLEKQIEEGTEYSFLDPRHKGIQDDGNEDEDKPSGSGKSAEGSADTMARPEQNLHWEGASYNPIAADVAKKTREERAFRKRQQKKRALLKEQVRKENARKILKLDQANQAQDNSNRNEGAAGWLLVILAGLIVGGGVGFYIHGHAAHEGLYEVAETIEFPLTQYEVVSSRVNPFTNTFVSDLPPAAPALFALDATIGDPTEASRRVGEALDEREYRRALQMALQGVHLAPNSAAAAELLESTLQTWIESGIDAPSRIDDPTAVSVLAEYYISGAKPNLADGLYVLHASALDDNAMAMRILGLLFGQGHLVPQSPALARKWLLEAALKGDLDAQFYFGEASVFGTMIPRNDEGFVFIQRASNAGHPRSLLFRGFCCIEGLGIDKDEEAGYGYVARAAEKGSLEALFQMGLCRAQGIGTPKSATAAASSFKTAADLGYVPAMYQHAQCLIVGFGVPKSYADGVSWMKKAAAAGHFEAQNWCAQHQAEYQKPVAEN